MSKKLTCINPRDLYKSGAIQNAPRLTILINYEPLPFDFLESVTVSSDMAALSSSILSLVHQDFPWMADLSISLKDVQIFASYDELMCGKFEIEVSHK